MTVPDLTTDQHKQQLRPKEPVGPRVKHGRHRIVRRLRPFRVCDGGVAVTDHDEVARLESYVTLD